MLVRLGRNSTEIELPTPVNVAPKASNVTVVGTAEVGQVLTGNYNYSDENSDREGISTFKWYANGVEIPGATSLTYTLTPTDLGKTIQFQVTPVAQSGVLKGSAIKSAPTNPVTP
ncbi:hypothetical protein P4V54_00490 [Brevibacillus nitrificans]|uniref:hypothetical protein n=1 Tax=Brevibacillus nitrificans TaxID=651560 RepID=UPI002E22B39C|nr:hypothetical protein [Brevibacillus nitrificans]